MATPLTPYQEQLQREAAWCVLMAETAAQPVKPPWYFKGMSEAAAQNWIGERLYPLVHARYPKHAGKITGMILFGFSVPEVYALLSDEAGRNKVIDEAEEVLKKFETGN